GSEMEGHGWLLEPLRVEWPSRRARPPMVARGTGMPWARGSCTRGREINSVEDGLQHRPPRDKTADRWTGQLGIRIRVFPAATVIPAATTVIPPAAVVVGGRQVEVLQALGAIVSNLDEGVVVLQGQRDQRIEVIALVTVLVADLDDDVVHLERRAVGKGN